MSDEIIKVLDALAEKFGLAVDWTSSNVIPYIELLCGKYINYEIATSVVWALFGIGLLILGKVLFKKSKHYYFVVILGIIIVMCQTLDIVTCFTFPEKIIIDELRSIYINMK